MATTHLTANASRANRSCRISANLRYNSEAPVGRRSACHFDRRSIKGSTVKHPTYLIFCLLLATTNTVARAQPLLTVTDLGLNGSSNREWLVEVAPDASLLPVSGGSLALELAFEVAGSDLLGAVTNGGDFPFNNPGNNPFTGGFTFGTQVDTAADTLFTSLGSNLFTSGADVTVITIETMGNAPTTLSWGGHTLLPGTASQYTGSRIAQDGMNFDGYQGSLMSSASVTGDFNGDSAWNCLDIDMLTTAIAASSSDLSFDMNNDSVISSADVLDPTSGWLAVGGANNPSLTSGGNAFLQADGNLDGVVNGADYLIWNANKFTSNSNWCSGDFNFDGFVNGADYLIWNANKFMSSDAIHAVPEPSTTLFIWLMAPCFVLVRQVDRRNFC